MSFATSTTVAAGVGIIFSAWSAGGIAALSLFGMQALLNPWTRPPTPVLVRQWHLMFNRGKLLPMVAAVATLNYIYVAAAGYNSDVSVRGYVTAALLNMGLAPITLLGVFPINDVLGAAAMSKEDDPISDEEAHRLVRKWHDLNLVRAGFPLAGAVVGLWSLLA